MLGGFRSSQPADNNIKELVKSQKQNIENKLEATFNVFEAVEYKQQVVAGMNYLIKIKVDNDEYLHVKIYVPLKQSNKPILVLSASRGHTLYDNLN